MDSAHDGAIYLQTADLDGDGDLDVLSSSASAIDKIAWYENTDGHGSFGPARRIAIEGNDDTSHGSGTPLQTADMDGDGDLDVVSTRRLGVVDGWSNSHIAWYENTDGKGNFGRSHEITTRVVEDTIRERSSSPTSTRTGTQICSPNIGCWGAGVARRLV